MPENVDAQQKKVRRLLSRQRELVAALLALREQVRGSVFTRFGACGKGGCACAAGVGHGPYYVLSRRGEGSSAFTYLDARGAAQAKRRVSGYRRFRGGMRRLRTLNLELLAALKRYQDAVSRRESLKMGL
jgi:hypothetical protein